ncbi:MAG: hypothetical protein ACJ76D_11910 [Solirubrobacterales bacterium]
MSERSLRGYLLLPRPGDLVKAWIFPAAFALGVLAEGGTSARELLRAAVLWGALELLIYQARYQWNDIRGFAADQRHPDREARGRLPGPPARGRTHIRASALVALGRLAVVAGLAIVLAPLDLARSLLALVVAVFGVAVLYEALRARVTGGSSRVPPPLTAGILTLWALVGAGYAIRGLAGLGSALDLLDEPWLGAAALLAFWSFGIAFVTGRWALEALAFGRLGDRGGISWRAAAGQAREHSLALIRWLPKERPTEPCGGDGTLRDWRPLTGKVPLHAPWNLAAVAAASAAALSGRLLAGPADLAGAALAAAAGGICAALVLAPRRRRWPALLLAAPALLALFAGLGLPRPGLVLLPWLAVLAAHLFFTAQSPGTLAHPLRPGISEVWARLGGSRHRRRLEITPLPRR